MTTRRRTLLVSVAVGLPLAAILYFTSERSRLAAMDDSLTAFVATPAFTDVRARCQTDPTELGPVSGSDRDAALFDVFAYDGEFHPAEPSAPTFSVDLADSMRGKLSATGRYSAAGGSGVEMGIATPWRNGNCALMLVRLAPNAGAVMNEKFMIGGIVAIVMAAIWVGGGLIFRSRAGGERPRR